MDKIGCGWEWKDPLMTQYHDEEWGVPLHDDRKLFEFITLDAFQAGLTWSCILKKREHFRQAFDQFNPEVIAQYQEEKIASLLADAGIIRNKAKINATITNARQFLELQAKYGSFDSYIWKFVAGRPLQNHWTELGQVPAKTELSDLMSKELVSQGFKFVGSTICYAFMQAAGMVNDHLVQCFRHQQIRQWKEP